MDKTVLSSLQAYAKDFYSTTDFEKSTDNIIGSPLGSWLLLASMAAGFDYTGKEILKKEMEDRLHMSVEAAAKTVADLTKSHTSLNYVAQAWSREALGFYPNLKKWVESNTVIPYKPAIPSQEEIDEWAKKHSKGLIEQFPMQMKEETLLVVANIIYSKLQWEKPFRPVKGQEEMSGWNVPHTLTATANQQDVYFCIDDAEDIFAIYKLRSKGTNDEHMRLITCLTREAEPRELMEVLSNVDEFQFIFPTDERLRNLTEGMYVVGGEDAHEIRVNLPAWEASARHDLLKNNLAGYQEVLASLNNDGEDDTFDEAEATQVTVAKFDKEGFEAAALTTFGVASRSLKPRPHTLSFTKPFVFASHIGRLPIFSGYVKNAKDGV